MLFGDLDSYNMKITGHCSNLNFCTADINMIYLDS